MNTDTRVRGVAGTIVICTGSSEVARRAVEELERLQTINTCVVVEGPTDKPAKPCYEIAPVIETATTHPVVYLNCYADKETDPVFPEVDELKQKSVERFRNRGRGDKKGWRR